jgi:hydrogenase maturation factor
MICTNTSKVLRVTREREVGIITYICIYVKLVVSTICNSLHYGDFVLVNIVLKLHRYIILESNAKSFYLVKFTTWYIYDISLWIQRVKEWLVFLFSFVLPIGLEQKWRFMLNYNIVFVLAYYHTLLHLFTN